MTIKQKKGGNSEQLKNEHVLFVEGSSDESFDPIVLKELFNKISDEGNGILKIKPLGSSLSITSVAKALHIHHPKYYFLIDRDHYHDDTKIEECWANFPNPEKHNQLIWKRKEIENYFLDADYLMNSKYYNNNFSKEDLQEEIQKKSKERLFLDVVNYVIVAIREESKQKWIEIFKNPNDFPNEEKALEKLKSTKPLIERHEVIKNLVSLETINKKFTTYLNLMRDNQSELSYGKGEWLNMIQGKIIFKHIINSKFFKIPANSGKNKLNVVVKDLLSKDDKILPEDFKTLRDLISKRINETK